MSRTRRKRPVDQESKRARLEREWERQVEEQDRGRKGREIEPEIIAEDDFYDGAILPTQYTPQMVEAIKARAEELINQGEPANVAIEKARSRVPFSVQSMASDYPHEMGGGGLVWWTGGSLNEYIPLKDYGNPERQRDLRAFALISQFILNAESVLTKKVQALQWTVEGGRNLASKWQRRLNNFENGDGWDMFIAKWIRAYAESDNPAIAELIRAAPRWAVDENGQLTERGERAIEKGDDKAWEIVDARVMDPIKIFPTTSVEFPISYHNSSTGRRHYLRTYQFMSLIDLPSVDDRYMGMGVCAVSRAVWAAQQDRMITRYSMEKMSENPGAGIGVINAATRTLSTALDDAKAKREARGVVYYKGVIFLPVLDPSGGTKLEFLSFAGLPDNFDHSVEYNIIKEIVATSFGLDILELGSIPGRLGTATQAKVAAQKGRTKTIGAIMQGIERAFRYKLLPESVSFRIKKHDVDEEMQRAEIDEIYFQNAIRMAQFALDPRLPQQYLVDKGAVPNEYPYRQEDLTEHEEIADVEGKEPSEAEVAEDETATQAEQAPATVTEEGPEGAPLEGPTKMREPRVRIDREGAVKYLEVLWRPGPMYRARPRRDPMYKRLEGMLR